jgi:hypothetical protein
LLIASSTSTLLAVFLLHLSPTCVSYLHALFYEFTDIQVPMDLLHVMIAALRRSVLDAVTLGMVP